MKNSIIIIFITTIISCNYAVKKNPKTNSIDDKIDISINKEIVRDIDGNEYATIKINGRVWMASNLKTTKFSNGEQIPNLLKDSEWKKSNGPAFCVFNNSNDKLEFGCLYNLAAVIDKRNICPEGWHVPTQEETNWNNKFNTKKILNHKLFNNKILGFRRVYDDFDEINEYSTFFLETEFDDGGECIYWIGGSDLEDNFDTENPNDKIITGNIMSSGSLGEYYFGNKYDGFPCRCIKDSTEN
jgi:uncharacterized protein (TIGR02145 family)